jgi:hypothetical protein
MSGQRQVVLRVVVEPDGERWIYKVFRRIKDAELEGLRLEAEPRRGGRVAKPSKCATEVGRSRRSARFSACLASGFGSASARSGGGDKPRRWFWRPEK